MEKTLVSGFASPYLYHLPLGAVYGKIVSGWGLFIF